MHSSTEISPVKLQKIPLLIKVACHQHATLPKLNSPTAPPRNVNKKNKVTKTKICTEKTLNRNSLRIECNIYIYIYMQLLKQRAPPSYHNDFVTNHALGHMMYDYNIVHLMPKCMSCHKVIVVITGRGYCFHDCIFITPVLFL